MSLYYQAWSQLFVKATISGLLRSMVDLLVCLDHKIPQNFDRLRFPSTGWGLWSYHFAPLSNPILSQSFQRSWMTTATSSRVPIVIDQYCFWVSILHSSSYYCIWLTVFSLSPHNLHVCGMFCLSMIDFIVFVLNSWSWAAVINPCVSFFNWALRNHLHIYVMLFSIYCVP